MRLHEQAQYSNINNYQSRACAQSQSQPQQSPSQVEMNIVQLHTLYTRGTSYAGPSSSSSSSSQQQQQRAMMMQSSSKYTDDEFASRSTLEVYDDDDGSSGLNYER